jgi:hypothetical protein
MSSEKRIKSHSGETLNALLDAETHQPCNAQRYERMRLAGTRALASAEVRSAPSNTSQRKPRRVPG